MVQLNIKVKKPNGIVEYNNYQATLYANLCYSLWIENWCRNMYELACNMKGI
jgi:hypothetical protein